jgi:hypothetical protein
MDKAQRRRLMAAFVADAISAGKLKSGAVDFSALLFGDPDMWTEFGRHGAMVERVIATSPAAVLPTTNRFVGSALPTAMKEVEDDIVRSLGIEAAQDGRGGGKSGADTEYRRVRSRRKNYVRYLAERADYERLNRSLQDAYADLRAASLSASDLSKEFSLPLADVEVCRAEVDALIAVLAAPASADVRRFVPIKNGAPRRGLVLLDTAGRPRWGKRKVVGTAPAKKGSTAEHQIARIKDAIAETAPAAPTKKVAQTADPILRDTAILRARVGLPLDDVHTAALPVGWETATLSIFRIIQLLPYPRFCYLDTALSAFGYSSQADCIKSDTAVAAALESRAAPLRKDLIKAVNDGEAPRLINSVAIPDRCWRALEFYRGARWLSGEQAVGQKWPDAWDYLTAARPEVYTDEGRLRVVQLDAIMEVLVRLLNELGEHREAALSELKQRGGHYPSIVSIVRQSGTSDPIARLVSAWTSALDGAGAAELFPGFTD